MLLIVLFYVAAPLILSTGVTYTKEKKTRPTIPAEIVANNTYLSTEASPTSTSAANLNVPGAAKEIITKNFAPKATKTISTDNVIETGITVAQNNENSTYIYSMIALPVLAILILFTIIGTIYYWRR